MTWEDSAWHLVGFYHKTEFLPEGAPLNAEVLDTKIRHLRALGPSLGSDLVKLSDSELRKRLTNESQWLCWPVRPSNMEVLPRQIPVPTSIYDAKHYRISKPKEISAASFEALQKLASDSQSLQSQHVADVEFEEGALLAAVHLARESSPKLVAAAKAMFVMKHGHLFCEACGFDFEARYGERGIGFVEAHHTVPVSRLTGVTLTNPKNLRMLCSNCHRMVHVTEPWLTMDELTDLLAPNETKGI